MNKLFIIVYIILLYGCWSCSGSQHSLSYYKSHLDETSGDYVNLHLQYYKNNKLQYYKRISRFFNSLCYDGVLEESEEYNVKGTQIKLKKRILKDENGNKVDSTGCQFPYRFPFKLTYILNE